MTNAEKDAVLTYVVDNFVSPLFYNDTPSYELWGVMSGITYDNFVKFLNEMLDK